MKKEVNALNICEKDASPQEMAGEFFLRKAIFFIESKFSDDVWIGKRIKLHKLYKLLGRQLSITKKDIRFLLKMMERRFSYVERDCRGIIISGYDSEEGEKE